LKNNYVYQVQSVTSDTTFTVSEVGATASTPLDEAVKPTVDIAQLGTISFTEVPYSVPYDSKYYLNVNKLFVVSSVDDPYKAHVSAYVHPGSFTTSLESEILQTDGIIRTK
jgi:hypothetical protein